MKNITLCAQDLAKTQQNQVVKISDKMDQSTLQIEQVTTSAKKRKRSASIDFFMVSSLL
jgi:hypothetical protein